jgi:hypothetical protein
MASKPNYTPVVQSVHDALPQTAPETPDETLSEHVTRTTPPEDAFHLAKTIADLVTATAHIHAITALRNRPPNHQLHNNDINAGSRAATVHFHAATSAISDAAQSLNMIERHPPIVPAPADADTQHAADDLLESIGHRLYQYMVEAEIQPLVFRTDTLPEAQPVSTESLSSIHRDTHRVIISINHLFATSTEYLITSLQTAPKPLPNRINTSQYPASTNTGDTVTESPFSVHAAPALTNE